MSYNYHKSQEGKNDSMRGFIFYYSLITLIIIAGTITIIPEAAALALVGQEYFADGTGLYYYDDGTTVPFEHEITLDRGYYYPLEELATIHFRLGPEAEAAIKCETLLEPVVNNGTHIVGATTATAGDMTMKNNVTNIEIINGASRLEIGDPRALEPSGPIVRIKAGDFVQFVNKDPQVIYSIGSPPRTHLGGNFNPDVTIGSNFEEILNPLGSQITRQNPTVWNALLCQFTQPDSGYHYWISSLIGGHWEINGTIIVD